MSDRRSSVPPGAPGPGYRVLVAAALVGLGLLSVLDDLGGLLQRRYRARRAQPRNEIPVTVVVLAVAAIPFVVLVVYMLIQGNDAGNQWMTVPGG